MAHWIAMFDGQLDLQGPLDRQQLARLPAKRGLLALLDQSDKPIVLITAANIRSRLASRLSIPESPKPTKAADLRDVACKALWKLTASHFETELAYLELCRLIWPKTYTKMIAWRPAWFVRVDANEQFPHFVRTSEVKAGAGKYFGPFMNARSAERFIDSLRDAFDLCRDYRCLRLSPNGQRCSYAQMGRCASPCDGSISMDEYRAMVAAAADYAAGRREQFKQKLDRQMREASEQLQFERAAGFKARLQRLAEMELATYKHVAPLEQFRFVIVQNGGSKKKVAVFAVSGGAIESLGLIDYPLQESRLKAAVKRIKVIAEKEIEIGRTERLRMGLVGKYLISSPQRKGLILRWNADMTAKDLAAAIESSAGVLKLSTAPAKRAKKPSQRKSS